MPFRLFELHFWTKKKKQALLKSRVSNKVSAKPTFLCYTAASREYHGLLLPGKRRLSLSLTCL